MNQTLFAIRFLLILTAVITTVYTSPIESFKLYTFFTLLYIAPHAYHQRWERSSAAPWITLLQISLSTGLSYVYGGFLYLLSFAVLFTLRPNGGRPSDRLLTALQWAAMNAVIYSEPAATVILANLMYIVILAALMFMESITRQKEEIQALYDTLRQNHYELDEARTRMIEYAQKVENAAQIEERNRISKDIHDELGHKLIRVKLMTEAVIRTFPQDREKGMEMLYHVRDQLSESMETLRTTVRKIKPGGHIARSFSLQSLAEDFTRDSGVPVELTVSGMPRVVYPSVEVALYRNAQEAMTNAVRHGEATMISVRLDYLPDEVALSVGNNGRPPRGNIVKGLGLRGMEERIELLGGTVETETTDRFVVRSVVPYRHHAV